ncbi:MAG: polyphosphate polymerase domain-containing protein [Clostridia bacterium]|nr:polyphosphate polymerase domain-containing protein [Clostridia bacterium]
MARGMPRVRHELKYYINYGEYVHLSRTFDLCLDRDPSGNEHNEYAVRSLYFDTVFDDFLYEKIAGVELRKKYRIRIYNFCDNTIKLESKSKYGDLISKQSVEIPRELADQLIACDPSGLERTSVPLLHEIFREMKTRLLRPVVIVDYVREAYTHPAEEVRVTFDKKLRTGLLSSELFDPYLPTVPPLDNDLLVLEVKYNRVLPDMVQRLLTGISASRSAISKYVICRRFEEKEY